MRQPVDALPGVARLSPDLLVQEAHAAHDAGIGGVPFFIFNRAIGVSGAQEADTLVSAMLQAMQPDAGKG